MSRESDEALYRDYRFGVGDMVQLNISVRIAAAGEYEVLAQMPERDGERQYRVRNEREGHARVVSEGTIKPRE